MKKYKVLIVDDSAFMRKGISTIIEKDEDFEVVGLARNGLDAVEKVKLLKPDVVTMDVEMPEMDGIQALKQIMKVCPVPVVMLSALTDEGTQATMEALEVGAIDFFLKSNLLNPQSSEDVRSEFRLKLKVACQARLPKENKPILSVADVKPYPSPSISSKKYELILIGSSTGGPSALQQIISRIDADFSIPILIVQHMPPGFTKPLSERLNNLCKISVKEAEDGEILQKGHVYIAPSGFQMTLKKVGANNYAICVHENYPHKALYTPSVDVTLMEIASFYKEKLLTVILTGMGSDGTLGCKDVKRYSGLVVTESEETSVIYGMPKSVVEAGLSDYQVDIDKMYEFIREITL